MVIFISLIEVSCKGFFFSYNSAVPYGTVGYGTEAYRTDQHSYSCTLFDIKKLLCKFSGNKQARAVVVIIVAIAKFKIALGDVD